MTEPSTSAPPPATPPPATAPPSGRRPHIWPLRITLPVIVVALAMIGSLAYIGYVVLRVRDNQIPLLAYGFVVLGASFAAIAIGSLMGMWRAASRSRAGRAFALAIFGGLAALAAIGSFTVAALSALVWNT